ncbi:MAG: hypothetical protein AMJ79_12580 [Phycisphaerae bacterium SM23_30]|nr:MAG: hypothetical protein AMJ79_12580 [Phycisphaerae bacterium SM23_30]
MILCVFMDKFRRIYGNREEPDNRALAAAAAALRSRSSRSSDILKIVRLLHNSDPAVRISALQSLAGIGGSNNVPYVMQCLDDRDRGVRIAACHALSRMRAHSAKAKLYDALNDRNAEVCCAAAIALAEMGDREGLPTVTKLVCTSGPHQLEALRALSRIVKQKFPLNQRGLKQAIRWIKLRRKLNIRF